MLIVGVVLGSVAGHASASTAALVEVPTACKPILDEPCPPPETALVFQGGREANRVTLVTVVGAGIRISDAGAVIEPGRGCSRVDDHSVMCSQPTTEMVQTPVFVATGGGTDRVRSGVGVDGPRGGRVLGVAVDGGSGSDVLLGGPGPDQLFGGRGADRLRGRGGDDELRDASLRDFLPSADRVAPAFPAVVLPPGRSRDSFDGGAGNDTINYEGRFARLRINLANSKPIAGARGEHDSIRRVENAIGGPGDDRLAGNRGGNQLDGAKGEDLLAGRAGGDLLNGGEGNDVIRGGPGNDSINLAVVATADRISCGSGGDFVATADPRDFLRDDCERILFYPRTILEDRLNVLELTSLLPLRRGRQPRVVSGSLSCSGGAVCQARAELRVRGPGRRRGTAPPRGTLLGSQALTVTGAEVKTFELSLSSDGLRSLRRHRALRVQIMIFSQHLRTEPVGYMLLLRTP